jgi:UDP-N-acetylglucosamine 2-epimerase (non-hydrolysing)
MKNLNFILGTRPEAIKLAPLIIEARKNADFRVEVILTSQHPSLCRETLLSFGISPTKELNAFENEQGLIKLSGHILIEIAEMNIELKNSLVIVQGDTSSAVMGSYAAYLQGAKIAHIEAGLRSQERFPFPEEMNRKIISAIADFNFCATKSNAENLINEGIHKEKTFVVGNTVIDAMHHFGVTNRSSEAKKSILITLHRRENQGDEIREITKIISNLANRYNNIYKWIFITHPNPKNKESYDINFKRNQNIDFRDPIPYREMLNELRRSNLLITDSGGFQEEATYLGLPTLVLRKSTERGEAISEGSCRLVMDPRIELEYLVENLFANTNGIYEKMSRASTVFGVGNSAARIIETIQNLDFTIAKH